MEIKARCRYCGTRVKHFGDLCAGCEDARAEWSDDEREGQDAFLRLARADADALRP